MLSQYALAGTCYRLLRHPATARHMHAYLQMKDSQDSPTHWQSCERMRAPLLPSARVRLALSNAPKGSIPQRNAGTRDLLKNEGPSPSGAGGIVPAAEHVGDYIADPGDMRREEWFERRFPIVEGQLPRYHPHCALRCA